ncbi:MAG: hypothetical protein WAT51_03585, partial [Holophaga sp.]
SQALGAGRTKVWVSLALMDMIRPSFSCTFQASAVLKTMRELQILGEGCGSVPTQSSATWQPGLEISRHGTPPFLLEMQAFIGGSNLFFWLVIIKNRSY